MEKPSKTDHGSTVNPFEKEPNRPPVDEAEIGEVPKNPADDVIMLPTSATCNFVRVVGLAWFVVELSGFNVAIVWRTGSYWSIFAPVATYLIVGVGWSVYNVPCIVDCASRLA